jgi:hypothetical protein
MKILLAPNFHQKIDLKLLNLIGTSLRKRGHNVEVSLYPLVPNKNYPNDGRSLLEKYHLSEKKLYKNYRTLQVNYSRI